MTEQNINNVSEGAVNTDVNANVTSNDAVVQMKSELDKLRKELDAKNTAINSFTKRFEGSADEEPSRSVEQNQSVNIEALAEKIVEEKLRKAKEADKLDNAKKDLSELEQATFDGLISRGKTIDEAISMIKGEGTPAPVPRTNTDNSVPQSTIAPASGGKVTMADVQAELQKQIEKRLC